MFTNMCMNYCAPVPCGKTIAKYHPCHPCAARSSPAKLLQILEQLEFGTIWNDLERIWNISWRGGRDPDASDCGKRTFLWVCLFVLKTYLCRRFHTQLTSTCLPHKIFHVLIESPIQKCS